MEFEIDVLIIGGGLSGWMMYKRLKMDFPYLNVKVIDKEYGNDVQSHSFHLHKPIDEFQFIKNIKKVVLKTNVWDGKVFKVASQINCNDSIIYSKKIFGHIQISNINNAADIDIYAVDQKTIIDNIKILDDVIIGTVTGIDLNNKCALISNGIIKYKYAVSTISLSKFLDLTNSKNDINLEYFPFYSSVINLHSTNLYQMIYNIDSKCKITRTVLLSNKLYIELNYDDMTIYDSEYINNLYGIDSKLLEFKKLVPGRIKPLSQDIRKPLFHFFTENHNIFFLGRYGAWTYKVANDVWEDTKLINSIIYAKEQSVKYERGYCEQK